MSYDETIFAVEVKLFPRKLNGYRMEYAIINACLRYNSGMIWIIEHCDLLRRGNGWQLRLPPVCIETGSGFVMVPQWLPSDVFRAILREAVRHASMGERR